MKAGFVMLAGRSNVGKSTLLNALIGTKVAIVTPKPQTTRQPIRGILHDTRGQIVFVDTPGVFLGKSDPVSRKLNDFVSETLEGIDAILYIMDPSREPGSEEEHLQRILRASPAPIIAIINKMDLPVERRPFVEAYRKADVGQVTTYEVSAKTHANMNRITDAVFALLSEADTRWYPDHQVTDLPHRDWLEEIIREKVFLSLEQELPYSTRVVVEDIEDRDGGARIIHANIWTTEERYKRMIVGARGTKIKEIGIKARKELEAALQTKVFLELHVKVDPKWPERFGA